MLHAPSIGFGDRIPQEHIGRVAEGINLVAADDPQGAVYLVRGFSAEDRQRIYDALLVLGGPSKKLEEFKRQVEGKPAAAGWPTWMIGLFGVGVAASGVFIYRAVRN